MNFMTRKKYSLAAAELHFDVTISNDASTAGWLGVVTFDFGSDVSGDISLRLKPNGETGWIILATDTLSGDGVATWTGNIIVRDGDVLRIGKEIVTACTVWITYVYEPWGVGSWQDFSVGAGEQSSSSESSSSSSSSLSSASSGSSLSSASSSSLSSASSSSLSSASSPSSQSLSSESSESSESSLEYSESSQSLSSESSQSLSSESSESSSSLSSSQSSGAIGPCEEFYTASTFVTNVLNGVYYYDSRHNNKAAYKNADGWYLFWASGQSVWAISLILGAAPANWVSNSSASTACPPGAFTDEAGLIV